MGSVEQRAVQGAADAARDSDQGPTDREGVIARITAQPVDAWDITGYIAGAARDGVLVLYVRTGAVTFRCHDQFAVLSMQEVWQEAVMVAHLLWRPRLSPRP